MKIKAMCLAVAGLLLAGCSHNLGMVVIGKGFICGETGIQYFNGVAVMDSSRENSGWKIQIDEKDGVSMTEGQIKGVKSIERTIGKQCSGYLVELSKVNPKAVAEYLKNNPQESPKK